MPFFRFDLPRKPLVDTNVLFDFLLWRFCTDTKTSMPACLSDHFSGESSRKALRWFLDEAKPIYTSPHVIAEIHGLLRSRAGWRGPRLAAFWRFAKDELARLLLREDLIRVSEMNREDLGAFGPVDSSILEMATRIGGVVITE